MTSKAAKRAAYHKRMACPGYRDRINARRRQLRADAGGASPRDCARQAARHAQRQHGDPEYRRNRAERARLWEAQQLTNGGARRQQNIEAQRRRRARAKELNASKEK